MAEHVPTDRRERADRILDTAKDLLLRWGYRRVTVDEIAKRSGVGKGTIYLHWRTRDQVFFAVGAREAAGMLEAYTNAVRADPAEVALHRYMARFFTEAMQRPVLRAIFTRDADTLDRLLVTPARGPLQTAKLVASREYLEVLADSGLLREELRPEDLDYSLPAIVYGFFAIDPLLEPAVNLGLQEKAGHLADTLRRTFEPTVIPNERRFTDAAPQVIDIFNTLAADFRSAAYDQ